MMSGQKSYNVPAQESELVFSSHINGTTEELLARQCIIELCKGWPVYRDFSEWHNYRSLFTKNDAYVWTSKSTLLRNTLRLQTLMIISLVRGPVHR